MRLREEAEGEEKALLSDDRMGTGVGEGEIRSEKGSCCWVTRGTPMDARHRAFG